MLLIVITFELFAARPFFLLLALLFSQQLLPMCLCLSVCVLKLIKAFAILFKNFPLKVVHWH